MIQSGNGDVYCILFELSKAQDIEAGDGTTTVVVINMSSPVDMSDDELLVSSLSFHCSICIDIGIFAQKPSYKSKIKM
uniref:Uncharacterized protein n=1 Tax=Heterorhabditis bacteriophora TaxID=37862 RepID=A0A1I7WZC7_HETBA